MILFYFNIYHYYCERVITQKWTFTKRTCLSTSIIVLNITTVTMLIWSALRKISFIRIIGVIVLCTISSDAMMTFKQLLIALRLNHGTSSLTPVIYGKGMLSWEKNGKLEKSILSLKIVIFELFFIKMTK